MKLNKKIIFVIVCLLPVLAASFASLARHNIKAETKTTTTAPAKIIVEEQTTSADETKTKTETATAAETTTEADRHFVRVYVTAYCPCKKCSGEYGRRTSTGKTAKAQHTIAVDPAVIPYGTKLIINGIEYVAEDCGAAVKKNKIDIFFDTHAEALAFNTGYYTAEILY